MFSRVRVAIRFFFLGLAVGLLLAPRSGIETRHLLRRRADRLLNDLLEAATLGTYDGGRDGGHDGQDGRGSGDDGARTARTGAESPAGTAGD